MPSSTDNELILIGGGATGQVAEYLASKAGGEVGIVTFALDDPKTYIAQKTEVFSEYNCKVRHVNEIDDLEGLSLVFYAGGDQIRLAFQLKQTGIHSELVKWWRKGEVILAGSSAGAMVMCGVMLEEDSDENYGRVGIDLTHGLGPIGSSIIAPHWSERSSSEWRGKLISEYGEAYYIFGIDENTLLSWRAGKCRVVGEGKVHAFGRMMGTWGDGDEFTVARGF